MKKLVAIIILCCILISSVTACKTENKPEIETTGNATEVETTAEQTQAATEIETEASTGTIDENGIIKIKNDKHSFTFKKTNFEDNYSEEFLMELLDLIPMEYGYDDYDNWNGTPNEILNDAFFGTSVWRVGGYEYKSDEWNAAVAEIEKSQYSCRLGEDYSFFELEKINSYLRSIYGPSARQFKKSDFEKFNDIINCESVFDNYDFNFRYAYLPETDLIVRFANEICLSGREATYVCDVKTVGGTYIVKAVTGSEDIRENEQTFEGIQNDALKMFNTYTYGCLTNNTFTICRNKDGSLYMKKVEKSYILPENAKYCIVSDDDVKVENKSYVSADWETVATLSQGDKIYYRGYYYEEGYAWVVTEEYAGRVEKKHLAPIE